MTEFKGNRRYPNPITVTDDPRSHTLALQQIIEALNVGQRRTRDIDNSFVRLSELVDMGLVEIVNGRLKLTNTGGGGGTDGADGVGVPAGGTTGQVLAKIDTTDYNTEWVDPGAGSFSPSDLYDASLSDLADVGIYMPSDGDILTYDSATGLWGPAEAASGGGGVSYVGQDEPPASPNAVDDEFNGAALDAKWSWFNQSSATQTFGSNAITLALPAASGDNVRGIVQSETGSAWKYRAKVAVTPETTTGADYMGGGITIRNSSGPKNVIYGAVHAGGWKMYTDRRSDTAYVGSISSVALTDYAPRPEVWLYLEVELLSGTLYFRFSLNGVVWRPVTSHAVSTYLSSITHVGLFGFINNASQGIRTTCDWFRKVA